MKHPIKIVLVFLTTLCMLTAYKDLKKGFMEGFQQQNKKPVMKPHLIESQYTRFDDFTLPLIIKTY